MQSLNFICQVLLVVCLTWSQAKSTAANNSEHYQITWNLLLDLQTVIFNSSELVSYIIDKHDLPYHLCNFT